MSKEKKVGCALAAAIVGGMAVAAYLIGGTAGATGYVLGAMFAGQWAWTLKGVK